MGINDQWTNGQSATTLLQAILPHFTPSQRIPALAQAEQVYPSHILKHGT